MEAEIHVLHVLNSAHGGSALSTFQLIEELKNLNVQSSLVCFNNATKEQEHYIEELVNGRYLFIPLYWTNKRIRVSWWKRPLLEVYNIYHTWRGYKFQGKIKTLIKNENINLIHTSTLVNAEGAIAARHNHLPHVWHARELVGPDKHYQFSNYKRWAAYVNHHCDVLIANSKVTRSNLLNYFSDHKVICIPNGIEPSEFTTMRHSNDKVRVVGMIGNVTSELKNHEFFIRVASHFLKVENVEFRVYGSLPDSNSPYLKKIMNLINSLGLKQKVRLMGYRSNANEIISELDILFHPTGWESFGRIFIEAMAGGVPVIGSKMGGGQEMIIDGETGFLVGHNNEEEAKDKIERLLQSAEFRNELGARGRRMVEEYYSISNMTDNIYKLYRDMVFKTTS